MGFLGLVPKSERKQGAMATGSMSKFAHTAGNLTPANVLSP